MTEASSDNVSGLEVLDLPQLVGDPDELLKHLASGPPVVALHARQRIPTESAGATVL